MVPLSGAVAVEVDGSTLRRWTDGPSVFAGPTDVGLHRHRVRSVTLHSERGGRFAICGARTERSLPLRYLPAAKVPVELRGAGQCQPAGAQLRHPGRADGQQDHRLRGDHPGRQLVLLSRPQARPGERARVRAGGDLLLRDRGRTGRRTRPGLLPDLVLTRPRRSTSSKRSATATRCWCRTAGTDPARRAPAHDMYYLNVMAGPGAGAGVEDLRPPGAVLDPRHLGRPAHRPPTHRRGIARMSTVQPDRRAGVGEVPRRAVHRSPTGSSRSCSPAASASSATATWPVSARRCCRPSSTSPSSLPYILGRNEQAMVHTAVAYARMKNRLQTYAVSSSVGPGATNMVTGAALATINRLPVLLLPADTFADRSASPLLQELELAVRRRRHGERRVPAGVEVLRPDLAARAAARRAARRRCGC